MCRLACCSFVDDLIAFPKRSTVKRSKKTQELRILSRSLSDCQSLIIQYHQLDFSNNRKLQRTYTWKQIIVAIQKDCVRSRDLIEYRIVQKRRRNVTLTFVRRRGSGWPNTWFRSKSIFFGVNWFRTIHLQRVEKCRCQSTIRMILFA